MSWADSSQLSPSSGITLDKELSPPKSHPLPSHTHYFQWLAYFRVQTLAFLPQFKMFKKGSPSSRAFICEKVWGFVEAASHFNFSFCLVASFTLTQVVIPNKLVAFKSLFQTLFPGDLNLQYFRIWFLEQLANGDDCVFKIFIHSVCLCICIEHYLSLGRSPRLAHICFCFHFYYPIRFWPALKKYCNFISATRHMVGGHIFPFTKPPFFFWFPSPPIFHLIRSNHN